MSSKDPFSEQLETMRRQMLDLSRQSEHSAPRDGVLPEALEHLGTALEELSVTGEELRQQTEELVRTRQAAEAERQRYQDLFQNAPEGCLVTDPGGVIQEGNLAAAGMLGVRPERLPGKPLLVFIAPAARDAYLDRLTRVGREAESLPIRWQSSLQPRNGPALPVLLTVQSSRTFSGICNLRWTLRQAAARPPAQGPPEHDQTLAGLRRMAGRMVHHLANDLATIQGQVELLQAPDLPPKFREGLETLRAASNSAGEIARRVQVFSRLRPAAPLQPTDLAETLRQALAIARPHQPRRAVTVHSQLGELPPVLGDAAEIREALIQLILNAMEAMPGGGTLTISGRLAHSEPAPEGPAARRVALTLADSGVGISEEVRQHLFEPFFTTKGVERAGLGLAMVYGIMRRHLGSLDVSSVPGRGCSVTLWFQVAASPGGSLAPPRQAGRLDGLRVFMIDDNEMVRRTLAAILRRGGMVVAEATGGAEALARLAEVSPDLVITDLQMPGMSGWEVARALKARTPDLPVIILTGWGDSPAGIEEGTCAADRILAKPIEREQLLRIIAELVALRQEPPPQ